MSQASDGQRLRYIVTNGDVHLFGGYLWSFYRFAKDQFSVQQFQT
jgi:hypothetical protein